MESAVKVMVADALMKSLKICRDFAVAYPLPIFVANNLYRLLAISVNWRSQFTFMATADERASI